MPSGTQLALQPNSQNLSIDGGGGTAFQASGSGSGAIYNVTSTMYLANFELIGAAFSNSGAAFDPSVDAEVNAYECAIWACVQAYQVTMTASKQSQVITQSYSHVVNVGGGDAPGAVNFIALPVDMNPAPGANYSFFPLWAWDDISGFINPLINGSVWMTR